MNRMLDSVGARQVSRHYGVWKSQHAQRDCEVAPEDLSRPQPVSAAICAGSSARWMFFSGVARERSVCATRLWRSEPPFSRFHRLLDAAIHLACCWPQGASILHISILSNQHRVRGSFGSLLNHQLIAGSRSRCSLSRCGPWSSSARPRARPLRARSAPSAGERDWSAEEGLLARWDRSLR